MVQWLMWARNARNDTIAAKHCHLRQALREGDCKVYPTRKWGALENLTVAVRGE